MGMCDALGSISNTSSVIRDGQTTPVIRIQEVKSYEALLSVCISDESSRTLFYISHS